MWSRYCLSFRNTVVSPTCGAVSSTCSICGTNSCVLEGLAVPAPQVGLTRVFRKDNHEAGTAYPSGTQELVPHLEQVLRTLSEHMS
jgi:hypothetical protein